MKINIGPYPSRINLHKYEDRWLQYNHKKDYYDVEEKEYTLADKIVIGTVNFLQKIANLTFNRYYYDRNKRKVKIKIDSYDTWAMDHTLSLIILPMLKQLKETKHGSPFVELEDVPKTLHPDKKRVKMHKKGEIAEWEVDDTVHERWGWVLDEMIYAFECEVDEDWEMQFYSGEHDFQWKPLDNGMSQMVKGPNDTFKVDREAMDKAWDRRKNGLRLFGKYYHGLWD